MKKFKLIYPLALLVFCCFSCTPSTSETNSPNSDLEDIVEAPPKKKVNQAPAPTASKIQTTTGTFSEIEEGDYVYLHLEDENKKNKTFTFWRAYEGAAELNTGNWEASKGKKIKVTWEENMENIPESGEKMLVKKILGIEIL